MKARRRPHPSPVWRLASTAGVLGLLAWQAQAQDARPGGGGVRVQTSLSVTQTVTDNALQNDADKRSDAITEVRPSVRLSSHSGWIQGYVDYSLNGVLHARDGGLNGLQQSMAANLRAEAVEKTAFIDASASIDRRLISPYGLQSATGTFANGNQAEVRSIFVSPYVRGLLAGTVDYEFRLNRTYTRSADGGAGDSDASGGSAHLASSRAGSKLGWALDYFKQTVDFGDARDGGSERATATLFYAATPDLRFSIRFGRESDTISDADQGSSTTSGWGVVWTPTERTTLSIDRDNRPFGDAYSIRFDHRTPRSVWRFSSSKSITGDRPSSSNTVGSSITVYDLLFQQFASLAPDPVQREALVNAFLQQYGIDRSALAVTGYITSGATLERRDEFSFALIGVRSTVTLTAFQSSVRRLDPQLQIPDDLANGNVVRQRGLTANVAYRLTPESAIDASFSWQRSTATTLVDSTTLRLYSVNWSSRLGPHANVSVGVRRAVFASSSQPYTENALFASLTATF